MCSIVISLGKNLLEDHGQCRGQSQRLMRDLVQYYASLGKRLQKDHVQYHVKTGLKVTERYRKSMFKADWEIIIISDRGYWQMSCRQLPIKHPNTIDNKPCSLKLRYHRHPARFSV